MYSHFKWFAIENSFGDDVTAAAITRQQYEKIVTLHMKKEQRAKWVSVFHFGLTFKIRKHQVAEIRNFFFTFTFLCFWKIQTSNFYIV